MSEYAHSGRFIPRRFETVGFIPASTRTPDIYVSEDPDSARVAYITFLTLWFLDAPIARLVKERSPSIVCALSPLAGGKRLETIFNDRNQPPSVTASRDVSAYGPDSFRYAGRCYNPEYKNDKMTRAGLVAVYAMSTAEDHDRGYTYAWNESLRASSVGSLDISYNDSYHLQNDDPACSADIHALMAGFDLPEDLRDAYFAGLFADALQMSSALYDKVPLIAAHELGHLLKFATGLYATELIRQEVTEKLSYFNKEYRYFTDPNEAVAELAGTALLQRVRRNADLYCGLHMNALHEVLPDSYEYVEACIERLCAGSGLQNTHEKSRAFAPL